MDVARRKFVDAIGMLDDEGFNSLSWMIYQQAKEAGGFGDHESWKRLLDASLELPYIQETQARFDAAEKALDDQQPEVVVKKGDA